MKWIRKAKRTISMLCCAALISAAFSGCGTSDTASSSEKASSASGADSGISGNLLIWEHGYSFEPAVKAIIKGFTAKYPNVGVNYEIKDGNQYYSLLSTAIQSGEAPDLFWTNGTANTNMADYVKNGALYDLTKSVTFKDINPKSLSLATVNGSVYSVPWMTIDTRTVYYNKDIFAKNNWKVPVKFSEFESLLEKEKNAGYVPISMAYDAWALLFMYEPVLSAMHVDYTKGLENYTVKVSDPPAQDAMNKLLEWADKGYYGKNWTGVTAGNAQILQFTSGKAAMDIGGSWDAVNIAENNPKLNFGAFQIPAEDGSTGMVGTYANGFSIYKQTKNLKAALAFAQYCASLEAQTAWVQALNAIPGVETIPSTSEITKEISDVSSKELYTSYQWVLASHSSGTQASTRFINDLPKVFSKKISVKDFFANLEKDMK